MATSESRSVSQLIGTGAWLGAVLGSLFGGVLGGVAGGLESDFGPFYARCLAIGFGAVAGVALGAATGGLSAALLGAGAAVLRRRLIPAADQRPRPSVTARARDGRRRRLMRASGAGALTAGVGGAVAGLVIGVQVNPPTAPFAAVELGLPAAAIGLLAGALIGCFR